MRTSRRGQSPSEQPDAPAMQKGSRKHRSRQRTALKVTAWTLSVLILLAAGTAAYLYQSLMGNVTAIPLPKAAHKAPAAKPDAQGRTPLNLLLLGSQTRDGQHGVNLGNASKLGTDISDTTMLVHIDAQRRWAVVVSIPRDLMAPRPQCQGRTDPNVTVPGADRAMFDEAMNLGGPVCAVATVEQMTGIRIDHFVEITFNAFQDLTIAVGGVTVCVPPPGINDPNYSGLVIGPGLHTIEGAQALEFVRDRHGIGQGTDLGRIQMQQAFVSSLFTKLTSNGTLSDPVTLYRIAKAVTSNITVDTGLDSLPAMVSLARDVRGLHNHHIQLVTTPYEFDPADVNRVIPGQGFDQLWTDLRNDQPLPGTAAATDFGTTATPAPHPSSTSPAAPSSSSAAPDTPSTSAAPSGGVPLSSLSVEVDNASTASGLDSTAAAALKASGIHASTGPTGAYSGYAKTTIYYPPGLQAQAQALSGQVAGALLQQSARVQELTLVLGDNAPANLRAQPAGGQPTPAPSISAESRTGDQSICSDLPTPVSYGGHP